jgi:hypothetical protein
MARPPARTCPQPASAGARLRGGTFGTGDGDRQLAPGPGQQVEETSARWFIRSYSKPDAPPISQHRGPGSVPTTLPVRSPPVCRHHRGPHHQGADAGGLPVSLSNPRTCQWQPERGWPGPGRPGGGGCGTRDPSGNAHYSDHGSFGRTLLRRHAASHAQTSDQHVHTPHYAGRHSAYR